MIYIYIYVYRVICHFSSSNFQHYRQHKTKRNDRDSHICWLPSLSLTPGICSMTLLGSVQLRLKSASITLPNKKHCNKKSHHPTNLSSVVMSWAMGFQWDSRCFQWVWLLEKARARAGVMGKYLRKSWQLGKTGMLMNVSNR